MVSWKYNPEDHKDSGYELIPEGRYRVKIEEAKEQVSKSGKEMVRLKLKVNGYSSFIWYYLVFDDTNAETEKYTNNRLGSIYDSFNIKPDDTGNIDVRSWEGSDGGAKIRHKLDKQSETMRSEVHYFLKRYNVEKLPDWPAEENAAPTVEDNEGDEYQAYNPERGDNFGFDTAGTTDIPF